jgi:signal transduction histidine kinase
VEKALSDAKENLQTLGNFATYMIHDLKNPLAGIKILADDLHNRLPAEQVLRKYTAEILIGVKRMEELINKTLDFARPTQLNLEIINLHDLIEEAVSEVSPANLSVEKHYNYLPDTVKADGRRLKRVFFNIILNAVQATPGGGTLSILTEGTDSGPKIAITDTGEGIPKDRVAQVFNPFFTTREDGHGLGLAFAKQIVTAHGGEISIESQEGEGTTVTIIIPSDETKPS